MSRMFGMNTVGQGPSSYYMTVPPPRLRSRFDPGLVQRFPSVETGRMPVHFMFVFKV